MEGGARWRFREQFFFLFLYPHHGNQCDCYSHAATVSCAHLALPHFSNGAGCAASTEVHCGSGSCLNEKRGGGIGVECMHSHLCEGVSENLFFSSKEKTK